MSLKFTWQGACRAMVIVLLLTVVVMLVQLGHRASQHDEQFRLETTESSSSFESFAKNVNQQRRQEGNLHEKELLGEVGQNVPVDRDETDTTYDRETASVGDGGASKQHNIKFDHEKTAGTGVVFHREGERVARDTSDDSSSENGLGAVSQEHVHKHKHQHAHRHADTAEDWENPDTPDPISLSWVSAIQNKDFAYGRKRPVLAVDQKRSGIPHALVPFLSREAFFRLFSGEWMFVFGDAGMRSLVLALLYHLEPERFSEPFDSARWFGREVSDGVRVGLVDFVWTWDKSTETYVPRYSNFRRNNENFNMNDILDIMEREESSSLMGERTKNDTDKPKSSQDDGGGSEYFLTGSKWIELCDEDHSNGPVRLSFLLLDETRRTLEEKRLARNSFQWEIQLGGLPTQWAGGTGVFDTRDNSIVPSHVSKRQEACVDGAAVYSAFFDYVHEITGDALLVWHTPSANPDLSKMDYVEKCQLRALRNMEHDSDKVVGAVVHRYNRTLTLHPWHNFQGFDYDLMASHIDAQSLLWRWLIRRRVDDEPERHVEAGQEPIWKGKSALARMVAFDRQHKDDLILSVKDFESLWPQVAGQAWYHEIIFDQTCVMKECFQPSNDDDVRNECEKELGWCAPLKHSCSWTGKLRPPATSSSV